MNQRIGGTDLHGNVIGAPKSMSEQNVWELSNEECVALGHTWLGEHDGPSGYYSDQQWAARINQLEQSLAHERQQREAAEAERDGYKAVEEVTLTQRNRYRDRGRALDREHDALKSLTAELLALAVEQRRALATIAGLDYVELRAHGLSVGDLAIGTARAALATDLDALLAEAKELGIDATTPAMPSEKGNSGR